MPELPEVETIRRGLEKYILGHRIVDISVTLPRIVRGDVHAAVGATFHSVRRYGKGLVIDLSNGYSIAVHVKMTGQLVYRGMNISIPVSTIYPNQWTHVIFTLDNESMLYYSDVRQFGWIHVLLTEEVKNLQFFRTIGPEPLRDLDLQTFFRIARSSGAPIKVLLMNQQKIAGVGNIYANDALFLAGIYPTRKASSLLDVEIEKLFYALEEVLQKSIAVGGTSASNYVNVLGEKGGYQEHFLVYQKAGEACVNCGSTIEMMRVGGRSTFYCPTCQK